MSGVVYTMWYIGIQQRWQLASMFKPPDVISRGCYCTIMAIVYVTSHLR
jgi:hypothetical protein